MEIRLRQKCSYCGKFGCIRCQSCGSNEFKSANEVLFDIIPREEVSAVKDLLSALSVAAVLALIIFFFSRS